MGVLDIIVFVLFIAAVLTLGLVKSKSETETESKGAADYFLAGRGLTWWLVGFSLIAANISTEQFVGMSGQAADWLGMAIASYEWMAAITLVVVAFVFLPKFLRAGIYTIPEFLEYRYNAFARTVMAIVTMIILVGVPTASVIFSGAKVITVFFQGQSLLGFDLGKYHRRMLDHSDTRRSVCVCGWAESLCMGGSLAGCGAYCRRSGHFSPRDEGLRCR